MIEMCSEHSALLKGVAANLLSETHRMVYSDWLQENGNAGWFVVRHYTPDLWPIWLNKEAEWKRRQKATKKHYQRTRPTYVNRWSIPFLEGVVEFDEWEMQPASRTKQILRAFAEGRTVQ